MYLESRGYGLRKALLSQATVHSGAGQPGYRHRRSGRVFSNILKLVDGCRSVCS